MPSRRSRSEAGASGTAGSRRDAPRVLHGSSGKPKRPAQNDAAARRRKLDEAGDATEAAASRAHKVNLGNTIDNAIRDHPVIARRADLALKIGMSAKDLNRWLQGMWTPPNVKAKLRALERALGLQPKSLNA